ncbi:MAG: hypothetical protein QOD06_2198, partial [Candidatus Binatota bacterium]|nr:hypothetical protein [Candidatus Binatota bacterium]
GRRHGDTNAATDPDADAHADANAAAHPHTDTAGRRDADADPHAYADAAWGSHRDDHPHATRGSDGDGDANSDAAERADEHRHAEADRRCVHERRGVWLGGLLRTGDRLSWKRRDVLAQELYRQLAEQPAVLLPEERQRGGTTPTEHVLRRGDLPRELDQPRNVRLLAVVPCALTPFTDDRRMSAL